MTDQEELEAKLGEAFHLMYDGLPEPVQLCHKTYRVVAVNPACAASRRGSIRKRRRTPPVRRRSGSRSPDIRTTTSTSASA